MNQATTIHVNGQKHILALQAIMRDLWRKACEHDGIDPSSAFVARSDDNPFWPFHDRAVKQYHEAISQYQAGGYIGLRIGRR